MTLEEGLETVALRRGGARQRRARRDASAASTPDERSSTREAVVVALGKIGLPLAAQLASAGPRGHGCDIDARVVDLVNAGRAPFPGEAGLEEALAEAVGRGRLRATPDTAAAVAEGADLVVAVPPLVRRRATRSPTGRASTPSSRTSAPGLRAGTTVAIETTVPVGTTRARIAPALEAA